MTVSIIGEYLELIILQYCNKEKAKAEISLYQEEGQKYVDVLEAFYSQLNYEVATGQGLDVVGAWVGASRTDNLYRTTLTDDDEFREYIRLKIAINNVKATTTSGNGKPYLSQVLFSLFKGASTVTDCRNMFLLLLVDNDFSISTLLGLIENDLIPRPIGVGYKDIIYYDKTNYFGFQTLGDPEGLKGFNVGSLAVRLGGNI